MEEENTINIPFDKFACEKLWALSSFKKFLFEEYPRSQDYGKLKPNVASLILQFDRHIDAAIATRDITYLGKLTNSAFAGIEEPVYNSQELLNEIKFRGYPVPEGLIEARKEGDWVTAERLLRGLHENMKGFIESGGKVTPTKKKSNQQQTQKDRTSKHTNKGGQPSPAKEYALKKLKVLFKKKIFKKTLKEIPQKELPYTQQILEVFIEDPAILTDDKFIAEIKNSDERFNKIFGTSPRNFIERWIPEALKEQSGS